MALKTKTRVNSRINNKRGGKGKKGKKINSFLSKVQGAKDVKGKDSYGFCLLHRVNVGKTKFEFKGCINCEHFIDFKNKKGDDSNVDSNTGQNSISKSRRN